MLEFMYIKHVIIGVFFFLILLGGGSYRTCTSWIYLLINLDISDFIKDINTSKADSKHWSYYTYKVLNERTNLYFFSFFFSPKTTSTRLLINSDAEIGYIDSDFLTSVNKQNKLGQISHVVKTPLSPHWYIVKGRFVFQQALGLGSLYKLFAISEEIEINLGL